MSLSLRFWGKISGPINDGGIWHTSYNGVLHLLHKELDVMKAVEATRARWLRRLLRSENVNLCRTLIFTLPKGPGKMGGKSSVRWLHSIESGAQMWEGEG